MKSMRKSIRPVVSIIMCAMILFGAFSSTALAASKTSGKCGKSAKWSYNKKTRTLTISGKGTIKAAEWPEYRKVKVVIKKGITGIGPEAFAFVDIVKISLPNTLSSIGQSAFVSDFGGLPATITIPQKVTKIAAGAFGPCSRLKSIKVEKGNKKFDSIDGVLFNKAKTVLLAYPQGKKGNYSIPNGTKKIGKYALSDLTIKELTVPSSVKTFEEYSLGDNYEFKTIRFNGGVPTGFLSELKGEGSVDKILYPEQYKNEWQAEQKKYEQWFHKHWDEGEKNETIWQSY